MRLCFVRNTTATAHHVLDSIQPSRNALLFYDRDETLDKFLFSYIKRGLQKDETVFYWSGIRTAEKAEERMSSCGIDCDYYKKKGMLHFTTYDEMFLVDGRLDLLHCHRNLFDILKKIRNGNNVRVATESNWWLLADVFENAIDMEATHEMIPQFASVVCTYNVADLLKYVNIYHLAKLMELHDYTLLQTKGSLMLPVEFYSYLGKCILEVLEDSFEYITVLRKKHSRFISEVLAELQMRIGSDMGELERNVEQKLSHKLKLN